MTAELREMAERLLAEARRALVLDKFRPYFKLHARRAHWHHIDIPPSIMDSMRARSLLFDRIRAISDAHRVDVVVLVCDMTVARLTPEGLALGSRDASELERLASARKFDEMISRHLAVREQAIQVLIQTPDDALVISQTYDRVIHDLLFGERLTGNHVEGPLRMFGPRRFEMVEVIGGKKKNGRI